MRKLIFATILALTLSSVAIAKQPEKRQHKVTASARPYKAVGHAVKAVVKPVAKVAMAVPLVGFAAFDAAVVDPLGVALQVFADGVDMYLVFPLQSAPPPLRQIGDGLLVVYKGVDKVGQVLAK